MTEETKKPSDRDCAGEKPQDAKKAEASQSRRTMIKAGLVAAPVILTLKGRPAQGQTTLAAAGPSRFSLGNSHPDQPQ